MSEPKLLPPFLSCEFVAQVDNGRLYLSLVNSWTTVASIMLVYVKETGQFVLSESEEDPLAHVGAVLLAKLEQLESLSPLHAVLEAQGILERIARVLTELLDLYSNFPMAGIRNSEALALHARKKRLWWEQE